MIATVARERRKGTMQPSAHRPGFAGFAGFALAPPRPQWPGQRIV